MPDVEAEAEGLLRVIDESGEDYAFEAKRFHEITVPPVVEKVLRSAIQNASYVSDEQGLDVDIDNLYVHTAVANEGPRMKRIRPAPMGRAFRYQRRLAHIIVTVAEKKAPVAAAAPVVEEAPSKPAAKKPAAKKAAAKKAPAKKAAAKKTTAKKA